jgi:hypothetical protein
LGLIKKFYFKTTLFCKLATKQIASFFLVLEHKLLYAICVTLAKVKTNTGSNENDRVDNSCLT